MLRYTQSRQQDVHIFGYYLEINQNGIKCSEWMWFHFIGVHLEEKEGRCNYKSECILWPNLSSWSSYEIGHQSTQLLCYYQHPKQHRLINKKSLNQGQLVSGRSAVTVFYWSSQEPRESGHDTPAIRLSRRVELALVASRRANHRRGTAHQMALASDSKTNQKNELCITLSQMSPMVFKKAAFLFKITESEYDGMMGRWRTRLHQLHW